MNYLNNQHINISFTLDKESNKKIAFLDILLDKNHEFKISVHHKKTYTGLLTNFFSFTCFRYKRGLIRCLVDRIYKINNTKEGLDNDLNSMSLVLQKNLYPSFLISNVIRNYFDQVASVNQQVSDQTENKVTYFKLPYIGTLSTKIRKKIKALCSKYCKETIVNLVFTSCKIGDYLSTKDPISKGLKSMIVYKFCCAGCNACYVGHTTRQLFIRIIEHFERDGNSYVLKHLVTSASCKSKCNDNCFSILDSSTAEYQVKEAFYIRWFQPK